MASAASTPNPNAPWAPHMSDMTQPDQTVYPSYQQDSYGRHIPIDSNAPFPSPGELGNAPSKYDPILDPQVEPIQETAPAGGAAP